MTEAGDSQETLALPLKEEGPLVEGDRSWPSSIERGACSLLVTGKRDVEYVTLNRPETLNALDDRLTDDLLAYFQGLETRQHVRVVVLQGAGRGFCSGLDLSSDLAEQFITGGPGQKLAIQRRLRNIVLAMRRCPQPIVAAMHGVAAGGGFVLAMACDIRLAARDARMNAAFIRIGVGGADLGASYLLPRLIGAGPAAELLLTGRMLGAERAERLGLLTALVDLADLPAEVEGIVDDLLRAAPLALRLTKDVLNLNIDAPGFEAALALEDRNQVILGQTRNFARGVQAFRDRTIPTFSFEGDEPGT